MHADRSTEATHSEAIGSDVSEVTDEWRLRKELSRVRYRKDCLEAGVEEERALCEYLRVVCNELRTSTGPRWTQTDGFCHLEKHNASLLSEIHSLVPSIGSQAPVDVTATCDQIPLEDLRRQVEARRAQCRKWLHEGDEHRRLEEQFRRELDLLQRDVAAEEIDARMALKQERLRTMGAATKGASDSLLKLLSIPRR